MTATDERTPRWATVAEAAAYAHMSARTIWRWIADDRLEAHRMGPRKLQVDLNRLDDLRTIRAATRGNRNARAAS